MEPSRSRRATRDGACVEGALRGRTLQPVQSYQEFWHSWRTFHPGTTRSLASE